jgi:uncharacterized membrane protein
LLKKGEKNNKVRSFTSIVAHACISVWKISQRASQNYANIESIDKYKINKDFPANIIMKACSTHAMHMCVKAFSKGIEFFWYDKEQLDYLNMRENPRKISQKSNLINY